jgi:hypothetical protein
MTLWLYSFPTLSSILLLDFLSYAHEIFRPFSRIQDFLVSLPKQKD